MSCKPRRTLNSAACIVPLYHWYDSAAVYEEFFKDKSWQNYIWKCKQKSRIKEGGEVHLLTPFTAELSPQEPPEVFIPSSQIDIIFEVLDEMKGQPTKLYIHYTKIEPFLLKFQVIIKRLEKREYLAHEAVCNSYLNKNTNPYKEIESMVERGVRDLSEFAIEEVLPETRARLQGYDSFEEKISEWRCFQSEYIGALSRSTSEKYLLDDVPIGNKNDAKNKIFSLIEILSVEERLGADVQKIWNAYLPEIRRKITHKVSQNIKKEQKALKLMQDALGKEFVDTLIRKGYVSFKGKDGNDYNIGIDGGVYCSSTKRSICLMTEWEVPIFDEVLAKCLFLKDADEEEIESVIEDARDFERRWESNPEINYQEEYEARKNASYDVDIDGRIVDISLEEQDERVN